jgi:hypothetical protein
MKIDRRFFCNGWRGGIRCKKKQPGRMPQPEISSEKDDSSNKALFSQSKYASANEKNSQEECPGRKYPLRKTIPVKRHIIQPAKICQYKRNTSRQAVNTFPVQNKKSSQCEYSSKTASSR